MSPPPEAPSPLPYASDKFVDRDEEIAFVLNNARTISEGGIVKNRTIVFWGHKGTGRTWLLCELNERLPELPGVCCTYINVLATAVEQVTGQLKEFTRNHKREVMVCLMDHVYETGWDALATIEDRVLADLASNPQVLIVIAGRGQAYLWKSPQLRLYTEDMFLEPFNSLEFTAKQLELQQPKAASRAAEIHELSGGYPLGSFYVADSNSVTAGLDRAAGALLDGASEEVRQWVEALIVLNSFDEDRMAPMLAAYFDDRSWLSMPFKEIRQVRDALQQARLARWDPELNGWAIDAAVRKVLEEHIKQTQPDKWRALHGAAYCLYDRWQRDYPRERGRWQQQADYHAECLLAVGLPECSDSEREI